MASNQQLFFVALALLLVIPAIVSPWTTFFLILRPLLFILGTLTLTLSCAFLVSRRRRNRPRAHLPRQLAFTTPAAWASARVRHQWAQARTTAHEPLHPAMSTELSSTVDNLFSLVIDNFVSKWFDELTGPGAHQGFPNAVEKLVRTSLSRVLERCERVDWVTVLVGTVTPRVTGHLNRFREAEVKLRGSARQQGPLAGSNELDLLLANDYAKKGGLHPAVDVSSFNSRPSEEAHLRRLVDRILPLVLPERKA